MKLNDFIMFLSDVKSIIFVTITIILTSILCVACLTCYHYFYWERRKVLHLDLLSLLIRNPIMNSMGTPYTDQMQNLYKIHPGSRYYGMFDFNTPTILVRDPEIVRQICVKNFESFMNHKEFVTEDMDPMAGRNMFSLKSKKWKDVRSSLSPSFTGARMKFLFELVSESATNFIEYFLEHPEIMENFEAKYLCSKFSNDIITTSVFGLKTNSMIDPDNDYYRNGSSVSTIDFPWALRLIFMPIFTRPLRWLGVTFFPRSADRFFTREITNTIRKRRESGIVRWDMIHFFIQALDKDVEPRIELPDIIAQAIAFYMAGFDTSSTVTSFMIYELAMNPEIQEKLYRKIEDQLTNDNGDFSYETLSKIKYLDMVLDETLRKYPPAIMTNRRCVEKCRLPPPIEGYPEYYVEEGTAMLIPIYSLHHDPNYFPEPNKFDPERFNDENKHNIVPYTFIPFGVGPRQCIGYRFSKMQAKIFIISVLRKFIIKPSNRPQHPLIYGKKTFGLSVIGGLWLKFEERKQAY